MCGRYVLKREDLEALVKEFGLRSLEEFHSRYNIAPTSIVPLVRPSKVGPPELTGMRWGLIPAWTKAGAPVRPLVNVRAETLVTRFRGALRSRRCILPASGFYEWEVQGTKKQPWYFGARDGGPIGLAGIWDTWRGADDVELETCAIVTTSPNRVLRPIHDRMPVILTPEQCRRWIDSAPSGPAALESLLASAPDDSIVAMKVGSAVGNVRNDGPECIQAAPVEPGDTEPQLSLGL
jgi:putative SOS response-associated peptidase YedK